MRIEIPEKAIVVLIGAPNAGKSTFAARHFSGCDIRSELPGGSFSLNEETVTVFDRSNIARPDRQALTALAKAHGLQSAAIAFRLPDEVLLQRNNARPYPKPQNRQVLAENDAVRNVCAGLDAEGFDLVTIFDTVEQVGQAVVDIVKLPGDQRQQHGPFDIIGDLHGCLRELEKLTGRLGYQQENGVWRHPQGRRMAFVGDYVDKGSQSIPVLLTVKQIVDSGCGWAVIGNHDEKLLRCLQGQNVQTNPNMLATLAAYRQLDPQTQQALIAFLSAMPSQLVLDDGRLVVVHAAIRPEYINKNSAEVREFCRYGEILREFDNFNAPLRTFDWTKAFTGSPVVVYGHTPDYQPRRMGSTIGIDTGCVLGGRLTALRYPEMTFVSVPSHKHSQTHH
jgi:protein phosphatase